MAFYCNGKKGLCDRDILCADCNYFDNSGGNHLKTNADRIRAMSDEELAKFLNFLVELEFCLNTGSDSCEECELSEICNLYPGQELDWLQHPVKEDS